MSDIRIRGKLADIQFTIGEGSEHVWLECNIPKNLSELTEDLAKRIQWYLRFPEKVKSYYRDVTISDVQAKSSHVLLTHRKKSPRMVLARLDIAYNALRSVHWWLEKHRVPDRPMPEDLRWYHEGRAAFVREGITWDEYVQLELNTDKEKAELLSRAEEEAGRQLSRILIWLEKAASDPPNNAWEFGPGWFRQGGKTYELAGCRARLLEAFVKARQNTLTHDQIVDACVRDAFGDGLGRQAYQYVSELNSALVKIFGLSDKPIKVISGAKAYRFFPPHPTYEKS